MMGDRYVVIIERREDGGLRVYSDDISGLLLSHSDPQAVIADISPVLTVLLANTRPSPTLSQEKSRG